MSVPIGILGLGVYLPEKTLNAEDIANATGGVWTAENVEQKLGIKTIYRPGPDDGTQAMAVKATREALKDAQIDASEIDLILSIGEEWKERPLTTTAMVIQDEIKAVNAWGIDLQNRCSTGLSALKIAKDMMTSDPNLKTVLIAGGYRNGDLIDFTDASTSFMFNLSTGGAAMILRRDHPENVVLGTHIISDGSLASTVGVPSGGTLDPNTNHDFHLRLFDADKMKSRLNDVSVKNWFTCLDEALNASDMTRDAIDYLNILHIKRSGHQGILDALNLDENQTVYLEDYGHLGQLDQILSLSLGLKQGKIKAGTNVAMLAAGVGYVWAASVVKWGPVNG